MAEKDMSLVCLIEILESIFNIAVYTEECITNSTE